MSTNMLGNTEALRKLWRGPLADLVIKLITEGPEYEQELKKFLRKEPCWSPNGETGAVRIPAKRSVLNSVTAGIMIPPTKTRFVAAEKFVVNTAENAPVKISYIDGDFRAWFSDKIEEPSAEAELASGVLRRDSRDKPILKDLGGVKKAGTTLSQMFALLERQRNGSDGILLANGYSNVFYIEDITGVLRAVYVFWDGDGWCVRAGPVAYPGTWDAGSRVFSRNSGALLAG